MLHAVAPATVAEAPKTSRRSSVTSSVILRATRLRVDFNFWLYVTCKFSIYALHAFCTAYFCATAYVYSYMPHTRLIWALRTYTSTLDASQFPAVAAAHYALAGTFFAALVQPILYSVWRRTQRQQSNQSQLSSAPRGMQSRRRKPSLLRRAYAVVCSRSGFFGVDSKYFEVLFLAREFVETGLQSYQAFQMTHQSPRLTLNRVFVALLIVNCWSSSVVHLIARDRAMQRLLCIVSDTILDIVSTIGVPVVLTVSYLDDFDRSTLDWIYERYYDDKWFVNYIIECPVVLLTSWFDVCSRLTLSLSLLSSINRMKKLIKRRLPRAIGPRPTSLDHAPTNQAVASLTHTISSSSPLLHRVVAWGHRLLAVYGTLVLVVHLHSEYGSSPAGCIIEVRPWFIREKACALIEINCHPHVPNHFTVGNLSETTLVLGRLESYSLSQISIRHCSALEIPSTLDRYRQLLGIKIYNASIVSWSDGAALRNRFHPKMSYLFCVHTTFPNQKLPSGLVATDFPQRLLDIEYIYTNLRSLPTNLHEILPPNIVIYIEYGELDQIPSIIAHMRLYQLHLTEIPSRRSIAPSWSCLD
ncbi:hypothetical protein PINS_up006700 [Pythium insidiosum]|nr:hypothetical protein PINS_up006700 [Pythium insidiosum]